MPTGAELSPKFVTENLPKGTEVGVFLQLIPMLMTLIPTSFRRQ